MNDIYSIILLPHVRGVLRLDSSKNRFTFIVKVKYYNDLSIVIILLYHHFTKSPSLNSKEMAKELLVLYLHHFSVSTQVTTLL